MREKKENLPIADKNYSREYLAELQKLGSNSVRDGINLLVICVKYYRFKRVFPALKGRATLFIPDFKLVINEVSYFEKDGKRWVRLPQFFSGHATDKNKNAWKSYIKWTCPEFTAHFYQQAIDAIALKIEADALIDLGKMMRDPNSTELHEN